MSLTFLITQSSVASSGHKESPIDLCDTTDEEEILDEPADDAIDVENPVVNVPAFGKTTTHHSGTTFSTCRPQLKSKVQIKPVTTRSVYSFLYDHGLEHIHPVLRDLGYTTPDDLHLLQTCPHVTRELVLKAIRKDGRVLLKDWNVLHAALTD